MMSEQRRSAGCRRLEVMMASVLRPARCGCRSAGIVCCILAGAVMSSGLAAAAGPSDSVLIRNVRLIDPEGVTDYVVVNVLVKNGELDIVTKDEIEFDSVDIVVNADSGVLFGQLGHREGPQTAVDHTSLRGDREGIHQSASTRPAHIPDVGSILFED